MNHIDIEIGGKKRTVRFGIKVIGDCIKHTNQDAGDFFTSLSKNSFESLPLIFFYGIKYDIERSGGIIDFTLFDVCEWLEETGLESETVDSVTKRFIRSLYENVPIIKEVVDSQDEEIKKNLIGI